ncbi:MAG TPA: restriction endonuclease subunit S [Elusimicrobiota bacterium]|nr:restriction endonuclease subunit S [Elusimicrobiota bacterium]
MANQISTLAMGQKFKKTPAGEIPVDWEANKLSAVAQMYSGGTPLRTRSDYFDGNIPWVKSGELRTRLITRTEESLTEVGLKSSSAKWVPENTVLLAMYGATAGQIALLKIRATINQAILAILPNQEKLSSEYLYQALKAEVSRLISLTQGSGQPNLSQGLVGNLWISIPPVQEQKKIAEILSAVDSAIEKTSAVIEKSQTLKKGLMQTLLTNGTENWDVVRLQDVAEQSEQRFEPTITDTRPYIGLEHIGSGDGRVLTIGNSKSVASLKTVFRKGDILFGKLRPNLRKIAIAPSEGVCSTDIIVIRPTKAVYSEFLFYRLQSSDAFDFAIGTVAGTKMPRTSWILFKNFEFLCPPLNEQQKIVEILSAADEEIEKEDIALKKIQGLKKSLMQMLLRGRVRIGAFQNGGRVL